MVVSGLEILEAKKLDNNDEDRKRWLDLHRELEFERRLREKRKKIAIRKKQRPSSRLALPYLVLRAPAELDFDQHYEQTITYLERVRRTSAAGGPTMPIWMRP